MLYVQVEPRSEVEREGKGNVLVDLRFLRLEIEDKFQYSTSIGGLAGFSFCPVGPDTQTKVYTFLQVILEFLAPA